MSKGSHAREPWPMRLRVGSFLCVGLLYGGVAAAQTQTAPATPAPAQTPAAALLNATPTSETFTLAYFNRPIAVLRANVLGRTPSERAFGVQRALDEVVEQGISGPVSSQLIDGGVLISVGPRVVLGLTSADIDSLSGETVQTVAAQTVDRLQQALSEAVEARTPGALLRAAGMTLLALLAGLTALWIIARVHRRVTAKLITVTEKTVVKSKIADAELVRGMRLDEFERRLVTALRVVLNLLIVYAVLAFGLRRFPYTRPWGESLRGFLFQTFESLGLGMVSALPGLFTVAVIFLITRFLARLIGLWFTAVAEGRVTARWIHPETAEPTRRLLTTLAWLFAIVVAYPYLPGSQTEAFRGVSVFLGLMVTFGSSGLVSQIVSGFTITYSRALRPGDFVKIGDVEGIVQHLGVLSTKVRTLWDEEVTIPNAVVVAQTTTDYSRFSATMFTRTSVTIGYDAPWRQVQAMLLQAAERTRDLRRDPAPFVLQEGLEDFYVRYTLFVCLERPESRPFTLNTLHANIQDLFNEHGVQIMSPNYVFDPAAPKVVPKQGWYAAPASAEAPPDTPPQSGKREFT